MLKRGNIMSVNCFTKKQIELLSKNKYVVKVSNKAITYSDEFKELFLLEYNNGIPARVIFEKYGFEYDVLGERRISNCADRWKKQAEREAGLMDTRKNNSGRPLERELSDVEKIDRLNNKIAILEQENAYLKKIRLIEKDALRKARREKNTN